MLRGFFGNLIFAIIARMLSGNRLNICVGFLHDSFVVRSLYKFTVLLLERVNLFECLEGHFF